MNSIVFGGHTFTDIDIKSGNVYASNSPISETLESDVFNFTLYYGNYSNQTFAPKGYQVIKTSNNKLWMTSKEYDLDMNTVKYGTPVAYYHNGSLIGKFYIKQITQTAKGQWNVESISAVGVLSYITHYGGIYGINSTTYVTDLIEDIIGDVDVSIDSVFDTMMIQGYLPKASARDNLQQVLFAVGGAVLKDSSGNLVIKYNQPEQAEDIPNDRIYNDGKVKKLTKATKITLYEHTYFVGATTQAEDLFSNLDDMTTADHKEIVFDAPYYDLKAYNSSGTDITSQFIIESGVNYAIIGTSSVGKGRITGKPYVHTQRQLVKTTGIQSIEPYELTITDATLVSTYNSTNCLERVSSYYSTANEVDVSMVYENEKSGSLLQIPSIYEEEDIVGYVKSLDINLSNTLKAESKLAIDWTPSHLGNTYNDYTIIDSTKLGGLSGTWIPQDDDGNSLVGKECYIVMFSGASGGQGGQKGADGTSSPNGTLQLYDYSLNDTYDLYSPYQVTNSGSGGQGGNGGSGGQGAKRYNSVVMNMASSYNISLGAGGSGGAINGGTGASGGHTTFGAYSSDTYDLSGVYVNIVDRSVYCQSGNSGTKGGNGGNGGTVSSHRATSFANSGANGGYVNSISGGTGSQGHQATAHNADSSIIWNMNGGGGGGGGASYDTQGSNGQTASTSMDWCYRTSGSRWFACPTKKGGNGGNGASATSQPTQTTLGQGGSGGNGGGGGGGGGASQTNNPMPSGYDGDYQYPATGGTGGNGSRGGNGSNGFIVCYFHRE